jgi:hypothetical protein
MGHGKEIKQENNQTEGQPTCRQSVPYWTSYSLGTSLIKEETSRNDEGDLRTLLRAEEVEVSYCLWVLLDKNSSVDTTIVA